MFGKHVYRIRTSNSHLYFWSKSHKCYWPDSLIRQKHLRFLGQEIMILATLVFGILIFQTTKNIYCHSLSIQYNTKFSMGKSLPVENLLPQNVSSIINTCSNVLKQPNGELLVAVKHNQLRKVASDTVDPIGWLHLPPSWAVPPERHVHNINQWNLIGTRTCNRSMRGNHLAYAATQGMSGGSIQVICLQNVYIQNKFLFL